MQTTKTKMRQCIGLIITMMSSLFVVGQSPSAFLLEMSEFEIKHVGFNTVASDFGPSFVEENLWFSAYPIPQVKKALSGKSENLYYSLFKTPVDGRGFTTYEPRMLIGDLKTNFHQGPVSYCEKTGELFVTLSNTVNFDVEEEGIIVKKEKIKLRLVVCKKKNDLWTIQEELPFNDPFYSVGHPSINLSGDTLYFTSDNPALSNGGTDIFMVVRQDSVWQSPVVLGNNINTPQNEMFPFYHPSGMMIFASNRPEGKGGLDLYVSDHTPDGFTPAKPLDMFNTKYDDLGLIIHPSGEAGYFVSNRPGQNGDDDIYLVKIRQTYVQVEGNVVDDQTGSPIGGANVILYSCNGKKINSVLSATDGRFSFKVLKGKCYVASATFTNYPENRVSVGVDNQVEIRLKQNRSLNITVVDSDSRNPIKNARIKIDGVAAGETKSDGTFVKDLTTEKDLKISVSAKDYFNQAMVVKTAGTGDVHHPILLKKIELFKSTIISGVEFDNDSWDIVSGSENYLNKLALILKENPMIKIEIGSHTSSQGSDQNNLYVSQKRAESVSDYLVSIGITQGRIIAKGYGETQLLNHCGNGVLCTDEEHRANSRIEYKITGFTK